MKLLRAKFQNFRLLRDLELHFSSDADRKLTVIRAANESGKTTILNALQWALYGDSALPGRGEEYRLHPIDWNASDGKRVPIIATVDFELTTSRQGRETRRQYRIVQSANEEIDSSTPRSPSTMKLYALNDTGASPIDSPEAFINDELPPNLRDVFFTDGDRALSFIEADVARSTKRERVQRSIRSLLGLGVIEDAIKHVRNAESDVNRQAKQIEAGGELNKAASDLEEINSNIENLENNLEDAKQQFSTLEDEINDIDKKISAALQKGDKEQLKKDIEDAKSEIKKLDDQISAAEKEHGALFRSRSLDTDLLAPVLRQAFEKLEKLHDQGKIPSTTVPVLEDRLASKICICGETLAAKDPDGDRRRSHIQKLIDDSKKADEIQKTITSLYYSTRPQESEDKDDGWLEDYKRVSKRRDGLDKLREPAGRKLRGLEQKLDELPDTDIQGLRETQRQYRQRRDALLEQRAMIETNLQGLKKDRDGLTEKRDRLLKEQSKGAQILAEVEVIEDVMRVLNSAYKRITNEELQKVSDLMNDIFLEMIVAAPEQGAIIRRAEISPEFDIIVYGPDDRNLNPDRDLNGASRRALTLAFILALTKVSEVEAPNVIDTPLGMTSGHVRHSILKTAVRESAQLILFLTHDEIVGCEEIIDEAAGTVLTLTNPTHYPKMLVNKPKTNEPKVLKCECNHRSECQLCQRHADVARRPEIVS